VKPLLTKDEFVITEQVTKNFGAPGGVGEKLQHMLEEKGVNEKNWVRIGTYYLLYFSKAYFKLFYNIAE
jgi:hypothetical protein